MQNHLPEPVQSSFRWAGFLFPITSRLVFALKRKKSKQSEIICETFEVGQQNPTTPSKDEPINCGEEGPIKCRASRCCASRVGMASLIPRGDATSLLLLLLLFENDSIKEP